MVTHASGYRSSVCFAREVCRWLFSIAETEQRERRTTPVLNSTGITPANNCNLSKLHINVACCKILFRHSILEPSKSSKDLSRWIKEPRQEELSAALGRDSKCKNIIKLILIRKIRKPWSSDCEAFQTKLVQNNRLVVDRFCLLNLPFPLKLNLHQMGAKQLFS